MEELPKGLFRRGNRFWIRYTNPISKKQEYKSTGTDDVAIAVTKLAEYQEHIDTMQTRTTRKRKRTAKSEKGIYLRGGIYWIRWTDNAGERHEISAKTTELEVAKALLDRKKLASTARKYPELKSTFPDDASSQKITFKDFFEKRYTASFQDQTTFVDKKYHADKFIAVYGHVPISQLSADIFLDFRDDFLKPRGIDSATRNRYRTTLLHIMSFAKKRKIISRTELDLLYDDYEKEGESSASFQPLTDNELTKLMKQVALKPWLHEIVVFGVWTGWRSGSIKKLLWENVDEERGFVMHPPKNPKAPFVETPITEPIKWVLDRRRAEQKSNIPYVFYNPQTETAWSDLRESWRTTLRKAEITQSRVNFHSLRGTFARQLEDNGVPISEIQKLLGHTSLATTMRYLQRLKGTRDTKKDIEKMYPELRYDGTDAPPDPEYYGYITTPEYIEVDDDAEWEKQFVIEIG